MRSIPNTLTILRMILAIGFPFVQEDLWLLLVTVALITEFLDGFLARTLNATSQFGKLADPIADKMFVLSVVCSLFLAHRLTWYEVILVGTRDLLVASAILWFTFKNQHTELIKMAPRWSGKVTTALQFFLLIGLVANINHVEYLLWITILVSAISATDYLKSWSRTHMP